METSSLEIYWHESKPVYSCNFQKRSTDSPRLATGGGDNKVRLWRFANGTPQYLSTLSNHEQAVNVVRFHPLGNDTLATAGDDGLIMIWTKSDTLTKTFGEEDEDMSESWAVKRILRSTGAEIYDISWSPNGKYIVSGSMDNAIRIFDVDNGKLVATLLEHGHYVQGVCWDPLNEYIATISADRTVLVYRIVAKEEFKLVHKIARAELPIRNTEMELQQETRSHQLLHNETLQSFFRRLTFSVDGSLLFVPTGIYKKGDKEDYANCVYVFGRGNWKQPLATLCGFKKPALVVACSPVKYELPGASQFVDLPYKMVFAVATQNEVYVYDTSSIEPIGCVSNIHYTPLSDLAFSPDGQTLIISSTDGFCTQVKLESPGKTYVEDVVVVEPPPKKQRVTIDAAFENAAVVGDEQAKAHKLASPIKEPKGDKRRVQPTLIKID